MNVSFALLLNKIRPKDHIDVLRSVLPQRYSPLQANGNGIQSIYLTELSPNFAEVLGGLIGNEVRPLFAGGEVDVSVKDGRIVMGDELDVWERRLEEQVESDVSVTETEREAIVRARVGQGLFKQRVMQIETSCRITGVDNLSHLVASHCKPWRDSTNEERLNGENGLLLRSDLHTLFDQGYMTVDADQFKVVVSSRIREEFENGRDYYQLHGRAIRLPRESSTLPSREYLAFHNSLFR